MWRGSKAQEAITAAAIFCLLLLPLFSLPSSGAAASPSSAAEGRATRLLVSWEEGREGMEKLFSILERLPDYEDLLVRFPSLLDKLREGRWPAPYLESVEIPGDLAPGEAAEILSSLPGVEYVEEDAPVSADYIPADPYYPRQWYLSSIEVEGAWRAGFRGEGTVVAVVDTGVDPSHPDLAGRVLEGRDFVDGDNDPFDENGHGTHVSGVIAASGENGVGVAGVAWEVEILPVRVLDGEGCGYYSQVIEGIRYAADQGADVINLSLGGGASSRALQEAVDYALSRGALVVAAAGNEGLDSLSYPAACEGVIAVGAVDRDNRPAGFSNRGEGLDLVAPGVDILSDYPGGSYAGMSGTSCAVPQVAGALALLRAEYGRVDTETVLERIRRYSLDLGADGWDPSTGWGLLQVEDLLGLEEDAGGESVNDTGDGLYFAEGYTGPGFHTYLLLENPAGEGGSVGLEYYGAEGFLRSDTVFLPAESRVTIHLNDILPPGEVSVKAVPPAGSMVQVQRSMYFDYAGIRGGHTCLGSRPSRTWYFAEGYTGPGFDTYFLFFNPGDQPSRLVLSFLTTSGKRSLEMDIPPRSRRTLKLNDVLPSEEAGVLVEASREIVAERAMYFDAGGRKGGSVSAGATGTSTSWYFAEGYTAEDYDEWILMANPYDAESPVRITFFRPDGVAVEKEVTLAPFSRFTLHVDEIPGLENCENSAVVTASEPGVVAERAMYFTLHGPMEGVDGGHAALGAVSPVEVTCLPEGYTGPGFESWILLANVGEDEAEVEVRFYGDGGSRVVARFNVAPRSRFTLREKDFLQDEGVSAEVRVVSGSRVVVEGAHYFRYGGALDGGSC